MSAEAGLLAAGFVIFAGSVLQLTAGFGFTLISLPVLAVTSAPAVPQGILLLAIPLALMMVIDGRKDVDLAGLGFVVPAQIVGAIMGARLVTQISAESAQVLFGALTVLAAAMLWAGGRLAIRNWSRAACGVMSGLMGSGAGLAGPPLALLYANASGYQLRSTLAASFLIVDSVGIVSFATAGQLRWEHFNFAVVMMLPLACGIVVGSWGQKRFVADDVRGLVLVVSLGGGLALMVSGLWT